MFRKKITLGWNNQREIIHTAKSVMPFFRFLIITCKLPLRLLLIVFVCSCKIVSFSFALRLLAKFLNVRIIWELLAMALKKHWRVKECFLNTLNTFQKVLLRKKQKKMNRLKEKKKTWMKKWDIIWLCKELSVTICTGAECYVITSNQPWILLTYSVFSLK